MIRSSKKILRDRAAACGLVDGGGCSPWFGVPVAAGIFWWASAEAGCGAGAVAVFVLAGMLFSWPLLFRSSLSRRKGVNICRFARSFDRRTTDTVVIRAVFDRFRQWNRYPVCAEDEVFLDWKMDGMDFDDLVEEVASLTERPLAGMERNPYFGKVTTPGDLVRFFMLQPVVAAVSSCIGGRGRNAER
jgi:hypothetical protein